MPNLFISQDLGTNSSGNIVSIKELKALESLNLTMYIGHDDILNLDSKLPNHPFIQDYLIQNKIHDLDLTRVYLAHLYGGSYTQSIRYLKAKNIKTTLTIDAHNREESIKEFENLNLQYPFQHVKDDFQWNIYSGQVKEADVVIVPSRLAAEIVKQQGAKDIRIIPHGTTIPPTDIIKPISKDKFTVGYLGAVGVDKGIRYLIESWSQLNYKDDSELIIAGPNSKELGPFIQKYATNGKFRLLGYVNDISDFYNNISVYVQPSVTEGWGMEVLEAMSYSRPVIVSSGAGAKDAVIDEFIFEKRDIKSLSDKIQYFKDNPDEIIRIGQEARSISLQYNWKSIQKSYIDLWKSIV